MAGEFRKLNINKNIILKEINNFFKITGIGQQDLELVNITGNQYRVSYKLEDKEGIIDFFFIERNGTTTINPYCGTQRDLNIAIANHICQNCITDSEKQKWYVVPCVNDKIWEMIIDCIRDSSLSKLVEEIQSKNPRIDSEYKIKGKLGNTIALKYYTNQTVHLQGKPLLMFFECMDIIAEFADPERIHKAFNDFTKFDLDRDGVEERFHIYLPNAYNKIPDYLINGLKQAVRFSFLESNDEFSYTWMVFPLYKKLEGLLKHILKHDYGIIIKYIENDFGNYFSRTSDGYTFYNKSEIYNDELGISIANLYANYKNRNKLFHSSDLVEEFDTPSAELESADEARRLIFETLQLINEYYRLKGA